MLRALWRWAVGAIAIVFLYLAAAVIGALIPGPAAEPDTEAETIEVFLVSGPIHYDFLLPLNHSSRQMFADLNVSGLPVLSPDAKWLLIGWGAREFYTTTGGYSDVQASTIWRSFTGDDAVLRVETIGPLAPDLTLPSLHLSHSAFQKLLIAIADSFARDSTGQPIVIENANLSGTDMFFAAQGRFDLFRTCNTWVSRMIRASGKRFGIWTPTPYAVTLSLKWYHGR